MPTNCAECGNQIISGSKAVLETGLTEDLNALYHPECFALKERRMERQPAGKKVHTRHDSGVFTEPGYGTD